MDVLHNIKNKKATIKEIELSSYDEENNCGLIIQTNAIANETVKVIDETLEVDWIFFKESAYARRVEIGNYIL
jgi:hypothetical protein